VRLEPQNDGRQLLILDGPNTDTVKLALIELELVVRYQANGPIEVRAFGRDLIQSGPGAMRISAECRDLMTILAITEAGSYQFAQFNRFEGCESLAEALWNITVPDPALRALPARSLTVSAACMDVTLNISVNQVAYQGSSSLELVSAQACLDLAALINVQAI
jgi:hypothetical protein